MDFGKALQRLRDGQRLARSGWNGRGMWIALQRPDAHFKDDASVHLHEHGWGRPRAVARVTGGHARRGLGTGLVNPE